MKVTPWFPPYVKPVRDGVYECENYWGELLYARWFEKHQVWSRYRRTPNDAKRSRRSGNAIQEKTWRGVMK
jgi:hypothetical protein